MKFKLLKGQHVTKDADGNAKTLKEGDTITSDKDLTKIFPFKFERIAEKIPPKKPAAPVEADDEDEETEEVEEEKQAPASANAFGDDVTSKFSAAKDKDLKVFYLASKKAFTVTSATDTKTALNDSIIKNNLKVQAFISNYQEEE